MVNKDVPGDHGDVAELLAEVAQLREALASRDVIGQAKGLLMATANLNEHEAFQLLVRQSQRDNTKLRDVAAALVAEHNARHNGNGSG